MEIQKSISFDKFELSFNNKTASFLVDRTYMIWFKAKGIAQILEYKRPRDAISRLTDEFKTSFKELVCKIEPTMTFYEIHQPNTIYMNEFGLYELIAISKKTTSSKLFRDWIYKEVLLSIRTFTHYQYEKIIENLRRKLDEVGESPKREIEELREKSIEESNELRQYIDYIKTYTVHMNINKSKLHSFIVLKIHSNDRDGYYAIRIQTMNVEKTIEKIQNRYPGTIKILRYFFIPNAINFYNLMKEQLKDELDFRYNLFSIKCNRMSQSDLLSAIDRLFHEKKF